MQPNETQRNGANGATTPLPMITAEPLPTPAKAPPATPPVLQISPLSAVVVQPGGQQITVTGEIVLVTPDMAEAWLAGKHLNRKSSDRRVATYTRDMQRGRWRVTNQGIGFDANGKLIDGEHRLRAVIASGVPTAFLVVRGLPAAAQNAVDMGRGRAMSDQYAMWTGTDRAKNRVAAARVIELLLNGWSNETLILTFEERAELIERYRPELDWAMSAFARRTGAALAPAPVVGAWAYAYGATNEVAKWVDSYLDGTGLDRGDPILALRNHMMKPQLHGLASRRSTSLRVLRALHARANGETLQKLYDSAEGLVSFASLRGDPLADAWGDWRAKDYSARSSNP